MVVAGNRPSPRPQTHLLCFPIWIQTRVVVQDHVTRVHTAKIQWNGIGTVSNIIFHSSIISCKRSGFSLCCCIDRPQSRTGSTHGSRENSSSRAGRGPNTARSASHSFSSSQASSRGGKSITEIGRGDRGTLDRNRDRDRDHRSEPETQYKDDQETTNRLIKELVTKALEQYIDECPGIMRRYPEKSRWQFFYHIFCDYLHLSDTKTADRKILAQVFMLFFKQNLVTLDHFIQGYSEYSQIANEILIDVPEAWTGIFQFLGKLTLTILRCSNQISPRNAEILV